MALFHWCVGPVIGAPQDKTSYSLADILSLGATDASAPGASPSFLHASKRTKSIVALVASVKI